MRFLTRIVVVAVCIGFCFESVALSQTSQKKAYRRPSESDVQWLLGSGRPKTPVKQVSCDSTICEVRTSCRSQCEGIKNPSCDCDVCGGGPARVLNSAPTPISTPIQTPTPLETVEKKHEKSPSAPVVAIPPDGIAQTSGEIFQTPNSPEDFPNEADLDEMVGDAPPKPPTPLTVAKTGSSKVLKAYETKKPKSCAPAKVVAEAACKSGCPSVCDGSCETKGKRCISSFGVSADCSCDRCNGRVDEIVASTLIGDCIRRITCLYQTRSRHGDCCSCWLCTDLDAPDMVGDAVWIPQRFVGYYSDSDGRFEALSQPTALLSRLNVAEHFNAEVRDRLWFDYRHFNNAVTHWSGTPNQRLRSTRAVDQFTFGLEKRILPCTSLELRVPILNQFDSGASFGIGGDASAELGNIALIGKYIFTRTEDFTVVGGIGLTFPTAEDWKLAGTGASLKNKAYNIVPYLGVQWHPNQSTFGHALVQVDVPLSDNELRCGNTSLKLEEQSAIRVGLQVGRWFYRNERGMHSCRLGGFLEIDYTTATDDASSALLRQAGNRLLIASRENKAQSLNLVAGLPILFGQLAITNAVIVPVTSDDRQFSVGYNFSLSRRF